MPIIRPKKAIHRRLGDLIVTIRPDGLEIRGLHQRRKTRLSIADLRKLLPGSQKRKDVDWDKPAPKGWCPRPGDKVWYRQKRPYRMDPQKPDSPWILSKATVRWVHPGLPHPTVGIRLGRLGRRELKCFLPELRPVITNVLVGQEV